MKMGDAFPSQWLAASDVPDEGLPVTIDKYDMQEIGQERKEKKPILHFRERGVKSLILNKTNGKTISQIVGSEDLDDWIGQKITLVPREVEFQGDTVWAIRVQLPRRSPTRAVAAAAELDRAAPLTDDDIPF